jgi:Fanconi anemia group M protein
MPYVKHPLIRPNSIEAREYQQLIMDTAIRGNTLVEQGIGFGE